MDYAINPPAASRFNARFVTTLLTFAALLGVCIGLPAYVYFREVLNHGVEMRADGVAKVDLKAMSTFSFDQKSGQIDDVPAVFRQLDGKKVELVGEMYAKNGGGSEVQNFDLVYSIAKCCFSGEPLVQHFVRSAPANGDPIRFYNGPVRVIGTLKVDVRRDDSGAITGIYHLSVESVEPV